MRVSADGIASEGRRKLSCPAAIPAKSGSHKASESRNRLSREAFCGVRGSSEACEKIRPVRAPGLQRPRNSSRIIWRRRALTQCCHKFRIFSQLPFQQGKRTLGLGGTKSGLRRTIAYGEGGGADAA